MIPIERIMRDIRAGVQYPLWVLRGRPGPDNHRYKINRILSLRKKYSCETFIETGTFYGQTVSVARRYFRKVYSVEIYAPLFQYNIRQFRHHRNVNIVQGDSVAKRSEEHT